MVVALLLVQALDIFCHTQSSARPQTSSTLPTPSSETIASNRQSLNHFYHRLRVRYYCLTLNAQRSHLSQLEKFNARRSCDQRHTLLYETPDTPQTLSRVPPKTHTALLFVRLQSSRSILNNKFLQQLDIHSSSKSRPSPT